MVLCSANVHLGQETYPNELARCSLRYANFQSVCLVTSLFMKPVLWASNADNQLMLLLSFSLETSSPHDRWGRLSDGAMECISSGLT